MELQHSIRKPVTLRGRGASHRGAGHDGAPARSAGPRRRLRRRARARSRSGLPGVAPQRSLRDDHRGRRGPDPDGRAPPGGGPRARDRQPPDRAGRARAARDGRERGAVRVAPLRGGARGPGRRAARRRSGWSRRSGSGDEHRWLQISAGAPSSASATRSITSTRPWASRSRRSCRPSGSSSRSSRPARTYGFLKDLELLRQQGLALGGSLANAVVVGQERILNGALRFQDEFVRHKILDVIGRPGAGRPSRCWATSWRGTPATR